MTMPKIQIIILFVVVLLFLLSIEDTVIRGYVDYRLREQDKQLTKRMNLLERSTTEYTNNLRAELISGIMPSAFKGKKHAR